MRRPHRRFKDRPSGADHGGMAPGGSRRSLPTRAFVIALLTGALVVPLAGTPTALAGPYSGGDLGSGEPRPDDVTRVAYRSTFRWADVSTADAWARQAIDFVAGQRNWMRDFRADGDDLVPFRPDAMTRRKHFARAIVRAFAPDAAPDPRVSFPDLDESSPFWPFANVAVSKGWMRVARNGSFGPDEAATMSQVHRALVLAKGLRPAVHGLNTIRTTDGDRIDVPKAFATNVLGMRMLLRYPSSGEEHDVHPWTPMPRIQTAYSLYQAHRFTNVTGLNDDYRSVVLPRMGDTRQAIVEWGARFAGFPYVWGGEWGLQRRSPLGGQSIPGFDCSGFVWWLMRRNDGGAWKVAPPRPYRGWSLPERTSATMAGATNNRLQYDELRPGDLMFYDGDGDRVVDHVDLYVGNGWALDSSNSPAGVTLMWVGDGWYRDHFRYGRRIT